jgi:hypothetical protein
VKANRAFEVWLSQMAPHCIDVGVNPNPASSRRSHPSASAYDFLKVCIALSSGPINLWIYRAPEVYFALKRRYHLSEVF